MWYLSCVFWLSPVVIYIELKDQISSLTEDTRKISSDENAFDVLTYLLHGAESFLRSWLVCI